MAYTAKHHVSVDQVDYAPGDPVRFTAEQLADYREAGSGPVAQLLAAGAIEGERPRARVALVDQSTEQLVAIAAAMGLQLVEPIEHDAVLAAIEDARARLAQPVQTGGTPPLPTVPGLVATADGPQLTPSAPAPVVTGDGSGTTLPPALDGVAVAGAGAALPELKPSLTRGALADIARAEGVEFADNATRADIQTAIEAKRAAPPADAGPAA